ncbi:hypothetical protein [Agriterribacter sp.]|uniref:hypothetical protein n=1 Tax=Agriterribacter sp. TaxID=2821509 RepID=UPI002CE63181|nr:hypothetical protein [Agriterribacter sp.]HTN07025.1 hypothetical protein [Agriterribacter sp.]
MQTNPRLFLFPAFTENPSNILLLMISAIAFVLPVRDKYTISIFLSSCDGCAFEQADTERKVVISQMIAEDEKVFFSYCY